MQPPTSAESRRILVVEDQMLIALEIVAMVEDFGCQPVGPVGHVQTALQAVSREPLDAALLDVDLDGQSVEPVADLLDRRGIPFALVTGYSRDRLPAGLRSRPYVAKPFTYDDVRSALSALLATA
jgi:CheY-like chemotaxis protein